MSLKRFTWEDAVNGKIVGASGTKYLMESELSADRYYMLQRYLLELMTTKDAQGIMNKLASAYAALNDGKGPRVADASFELREVIEGLSNWGTQSRKAIMAVCLFMNRQGDSFDTRTRFDEKDLMEKVADLEAAYGIEGFSRALTNITVSLKENS